MLGLRDLRVAEASVQGASADVIEYRDPVDGTPKGATLAVRMGTSEGLKHGEETHPDTASALAELARLGSLLETEGLTGGRADAERVLSAGDIPGPLRRLIGDRDRDASAVVACGLWVRPGTLGSVRSLASGGLSLYTPSGALLMTLASPGVLEGTVEGWMLQGRA